RSYWIVKVNVVEWLKLPLVPVMVKVRVPTVALRPTVTESVEVPEPVMDGGLKLVVTRNPWPVTLRFTVPAKPFSPVTVTVDVPVVLRGTVMLAGESAIEKSGAGAGLTTSVTVVECTRLPLVPVMVSVYVPAGVLVLVVTDIVDEPDPVTDVGLKLALAPAGSPLALKVITPLKPPDPVAVAV